MAAAATAAGPGPGPGRRRGEHPGLQARLCVDGVHRRGRVLGGVGGAREGDRADVRDQPEQEGVPGQARRRDQCLVEARALAASRGVLRFELVAGGWSFLPPDGAAVVGRDTKELSQEGKDLASDIGAEGRYFS